MLLRRSGALLRSHGWIDCGDAFGAVAFASRCARQSHEHASRLSRHVHLDVDPADDGRPSVHLHHRGGLRARHDERQHRDGSAEPSYTVRGRRSASTTCAFARGAAGVGEPSNEMPGCRPCRAFHRRGRLPPVDQ